MKRINRSQINKLKLSYTQKGYVIIKEFFSEAEMSQLRHWMNEVIRWPETTGKWLKYFESIKHPSAHHEDVVLSRVENFVRFHDGLTQLADNEQLVSLLSVFLGEPALFFKEKLNIKPPGGRGYSAHQDAPAFFDIDFDAISILASIDAMSIDNGCLYFAENNHPFTQASPDVVESVRVIRRSSEVKPSPSLNQESLKPN